ncbi:MAG: 30S ribosomal protein S4e [Candidatus Poseidoniaceae archaeon]|nr:30S ribosomal protein S4e [Candidatus Poseidoniaceae archaeon]
MGSSSHLKRLAIPRSWPLPRKTTVWVTRPRAGAHNLERSMPVAIVIRDVLGMARTTREVRRILHNELCKVDGRVVKDTRRGVGLMDVLTLGENNYRCVLDTNGRLRYRPITAKEAAWKVCRIEGKTTIKGGKTQVHLHDGRNIIVDDATEHKSGDSLKISLPEQKVLEHIKFGEGTRCMLVGGTHIGKLADVSSYIVKRSSMPNEVEFEGFSTTVSNAFTVGSNSLPGVEVTQ